MMKFNREEGLTLIELLITISVLAIVSAIALPVINNVVASSNQNALAQTNSDVADFVNKYNNSGAVSYDAATGEFSGFVDLDGDNTVDAAGEKVDSLTVDLGKFGTVSTEITAAYGASPAAPVFTLD